MKIESIWQYPVKSMLGGTVPTGELQELGLAGDRTWAVRDEVRGGIRGAKKIGGLMRLAAAYQDGAGSAVDISLPDGSTVSSDNPQVSELVSQALDHQVTLQALAPATDLDFYRRGAPDSDDMVGELMAVFGREEGEPLPDFSVFPPEIMEFESPPGTFLDCYPVMFMTTSALRSMQQELPESVIDVRRFRPTFVVDTGDATGHPEFDWVGKTVRIGSAEIAVPAACPRCVMVGRGISADIPADRAVLRHIIKDLDQNVGVYGTVAVPGTFAVGDPVEIVQ